MSVISPRVTLPASGPTILVSRRVIGRRIVLRVSGEIDFAAVDTLADEIDRALADGALDLWIDLSSVSFMDSSGLRLLGDLSRRLLQLNRRLAIICPRGPVRRVFEIAGVSDMLPLFDELAAAHLLS
jgi:anti-sigma B factor antagonist